MYDGDGNDSGVDTRKMRWEEERLSSRHLEIGIYTYQKETAGAIVILDKHGRRGR